MQVAIDILADCQVAGLTPAYFTTADNVGAANDRFLELAEPHFRRAAAQLGYEFVDGRDDRTVHQVQSTWVDHEAYLEAWQSVHDAVDVDLADLARQAIAETTAVPS